jgi:hypothetical protein
VEVNAALAAHAVDRNDVGMAQGGVGLDPEALDLLVVQCFREGERLERKPRPRESWVAS